MSEPIAVEAQGPVLTIALNRPKKKNALNLEMFRGLAAAYTRLCDDPALRCGVVYSKLELFSSGLDLVEMAPILADQAGTPPEIVADDQVDPFGWLAVGGRVGRLRSKPLVCAINGRCLAGGIEVALAADILIAEDDVSFRQAEIVRGLMPLGGAMARYLERCGWGNAMRWLLTGDFFDAAEAYRIGLVQEVVPPGGAFDRAMAIAKRVARAAPLGVAGTLCNAHAALHEGVLSSGEQLLPFMREKIAPSKDLREGVAAMFENRDPAYSGS